LSLITEQRCYKLYLSAIKSEETKKFYVYQLGRFMKWMDVSSPEELLQATPKMIQERLEDYIMSIKSKVSPNSILTYFSPLKLFYEMNDVVINYKKIQRLFPAKVKRGNERGFSREEVQQFLNKARNLKEQSLVLLFASSGVRTGAIPDIRMKHMKKMEDCYSILIYEGAIEEDYIFTTPECTEIIDKYLAERQKDGEFLNDESPLFRNLHGTKPLSERSMTKIMYRLVKSVSRKKTGNRYDVAVKHGMRKYYATCIKQVVGITSTMSEKLINHIGAVRLDGHYFKPTVEVMFEAYKKAIPELIIDNTERHKAEVELLNSEISELQASKQRIHQLETNQKETSSQLEKMNERIFANYNKQMAKNKPLNDNDLMIIANLIRGRMELDPKFSDSFKEMINEDPDISSEKKEQISSI